MNIFSTKDYADVQHVINSGNGHHQNGNSKKEENPEIDLNENSRYIQSLIDEVDTWQDQDARELMQECFHQLVSFYGHGLERIMQVINKSGSVASAQVYNDLIKDNVVSGLLLIHDLHPLDLKTRLYQALEKVKPYMDSHGGSVEVVSLENDIAHLKLSGSCKGCPSSSSTLELGIRQAIEELCPDLMGLEVEGVVAPPNRNAMSMLAEVGWRVMHGLDSIPDGKMIAYDIEGNSVLIARAGERLYAYKNYCPACDRSFTNGILNENIMSCQLGHQYDIQKAGACVDDAHLHLNPYPLVLENGAHKIAIG